MPIVSTDLVFYSPASVPVDDTSPAGGAIATASRPELTQFAAAARPEIVSDGADVRTVTIVGRDAGGSILTETKALNGATPVLFAGTFERIHSVSVSATDGARTVSVREGAGGTVRATIGPNETTRHIWFQRSSSSGSTSNRYEKGFLKNTHGSLNHLGTTLTLTADPANRIKIGAAATVGDSASVANRTTAPAGVTFVDDGVAISCPTTDLAAGAAWGLWVNQTLPANDPANKSTFTITANGSTV